MDKDVTSGRLVVVGRVLSPHGTTGELQIEAISDSPGRFSSGGMLYLNDRPHKIKSSRGLPKGRIGLKLEGINSRNEAESLRGSLLLVTEDMVPPLPEGEYYHFQLIGIRVYTQEHEYLGQVTEILATGSNDVYLVSHNSSEILIPALHDVVVRVDVNGRTMTVDLPEGLR
jgi:16S rRNA processing protein RimM